MNTFCVMLFVVRCIRRKQLTSLQQVETRRADRNATRNHKQFLTDNFTSVQSTNSWNSICISVMSKVEINKKCVVVLTLLERIAAVKDPEQTQVRVSDCADNVVVPLSFSQFSVSVLIFYIWCWMAFGFMFDNML